MKSAEFRRIALSFPGSVEGEHQGHPDFRCGGKIFASLGADGSWAMVKVPPEVQEELVASDPAVFEPFAGAWGRRGCTRVALGAARAAVVKRALTDAWSLMAPETGDDDD